MRQVQLEDRAELDDQENLRAKRIIRGRAGGRSLLSGAAVGLAGRASASMGSSGKPSALRVAPAPQAQK